MRHNRSAWAVVALALTTVGAHADNLMGFPPAASDTERALESRFSQSLSASDQLEWMRALSAHPHHVGSAHGKANAEYIASLFREWGYDVETKVYDILLPVPKSRALEMTTPHAFTASLRERTLEEDPSTAVRDDLLPPYNAFSVDGDVAAEVVFVNYGVKEDYEELTRYGIDVAGKVVIAKYGGSWRGIKPKLAAEHGAIGCLIYSDPADDGYARGDVYPDGPFKPETGVQRGAVMDLPLRPGDVLTPYVGAVKRARRLDLDEVETLTRIPVLPISWADALPLLEALGGPVAPTAWRGALPVTYHLGPGPTRVHLKLEFDWRRVPAYDVIATLEGATYPDQWIVRGNHHDGWNHGAADPISGLVALLSEAKAIAALAREGSPP
ncbi:MAG: folate hydrolase, partial [Gammaproteobacteria bacterium]